MKTLEEIRIQDVMPENLSADEKVHKASEAIDPELKLAIKGRRAPLIFSRIDELSSAQLDHLAEGFGLTNWRLTWGLNVKRQMLKVLISQKRYMGTLSAIRRVLEPLGTSVQITEWWQESPKGTPHTFKVLAFLPELGSDDLNIERQEDFISLLNEAKPVRSHYDFLVGRELSGDLYVAGAFRAASTGTLSLSQEPEDGAVYACGAFRTATYTYLRPEEEKFNGELTIAGAVREAAYSSLRSGQDSAESSVFAAGVIRSASASRIFN